MAFSAAARLTALVVVVLIRQTCSAKHSHVCAPSSCGDIHNISYPFRLQDDPENCGRFRRYTLSCENNRTVLYLYAGKYYVQQINYDDYTIRVIDSGIQVLPIPRYFLNINNFSNGIMIWESYVPNQNGMESVVFVMCENPVSSPFYLETSACLNNGSDYSSNSSKRHRYVKVGRTNAADVEDSCQIERMVPTSSPRNDDRHVSCSDVHNALVYGFELSWLRDNCRSCFIVEELTGDSCYFDVANRIHCSGIIGE
jgi:hypothetical protein